MSEVDNLTNDQLRIELLKFGFANMPVTQTTRKVLLKKLKVAMEVQKSKTRRETVAVMKASDEDEPVEIASRNKKEKTPRRATIAVAAVAEKTRKVPATTTQNGADTPPKSKSPSRRSYSRTTQANESRPIVSSSAYYLQDQSDDDVIEVIEPSPQISSARRSKSKTPTSLAKSETVRISQYATNVRNIPIVREEEPSTEEEDKSFEVEFQEPAPVLLSRRTITAPMSSTYKFDRNVTPTKYGFTTTTSYTPKTNYPTLSNEDDNEDDGEEIDAPYLSNFAKRLSTLRAEPLDGGMSKYKKQSDSNYSYNRVVPSTTSTYRYSSSQYSKPLPIREDGVLNDMAREFDKMDQKFSIRKYVYICLIIMAIVAVYVLLFL